ncbi:MAG: cytochrome P450 [Gammaproteobacteria bacterium]|nr:cytochrome P450 [Gammaproteobacteria bacterium]
MNHYTPPYPTRHKKGLSKFDLLRAGRKNLLSVWAEADFEREIISTKILKQHIIIANNPDMVKWAFVDSHDVFQAKSHLMQRALKPIIGDGLFISDGEVWASRRRSVGSVVHGSKVPYYTPSMIEAMVDLRNTWMQQDLNKENQIDMLSEMTKLTADVIARAIFGSQLGKEKFSEIAEGFTEYQKNIGVFNVLPLLGLPDSLTYLLTRGIRRSAKRVMNVVDHLIDSHFKNQCNNEHSFLNLLKTSAHTNSTLLADKQALRNEASVLFMAGHETTANCLAWAWFLLSQSPDVEKKLHHEIDGVLNGRVPTIEDVKNLKFTRAIIEETLRLYPPVPILSRQALKTVSYGDRHIPKGSILAVVPWLLHRHKLFWENPDQFDPSRFLSDNKPPIKFSYIPFSVGLRVCAAMSFGLTEAILGLAIFSQQFRFELKPGTKIEAISHLSLRPDDGHGKLPMILKVREKTKINFNVSEYKQAKVMECPYA